MINRKLLASDLFPVLSFLSPCPSPVHKSPPISPTLSADRSFKFTPETPRHTGGRRKPAPPLDDSRLSQNTTIEESPGGYAGGIDPNFGKPKAIFYSSSSDEELDPAALDDAEDASSPSFGLGGAAASTPSPIDYDALDSARPIDLGALDDAQPAGMMDMGFVTPPKQTSSLSMKVTPPTPELAARLKTFLKDNVALNTLRGTAQLNLFLRLWGYNTKPTPGISLDGKPTTVYTPIDNVDTVLSDVPAAALIFRSGKEGLMNRPPLHITFDEQEGLYYVNCYLTMFKVSSTSETTRKKVVCNIKGTYIVGNVINISNPVRALGFAHSYHVQNPAEAVPVIQAFRTTLGSLNTIFKYGAPVDQNAFGQFRIDEIQQYISLRKDDLITVATDACIDTLPSTLPKERDQTSLGRLMPLSEYHSTLGFPPFPDFSTYPVGQKKGKKKREIVDCSLVMSVKERCNTDHPVRTSTEEQLKSSDAWLTQLKKRNAEDRSPNLSVGGFSYPEILASSTCRRAGRAFRVVKRGLDGDLQRFAQAPSTLLEGPDFTRICQEIRVIYKQRLHETHMNFLKLKNHLDGSTEKLTGVKSKINVDKACKLLKSQLLKLQAQLRTAELNLQKPRVKNQAINKHDFNLQLETIRHIDRQVKTMQDEIDLIQADPKFKP